MNKRTILPLSAAFVAISLVSCHSSSVLDMIRADGFKSDPNAAITQRVVPIGSVRELESRSGVNVIYVVSDENRVVVEAPSDLQDKIKVKVSDSELELGLNESVRSGMDRVTITVRSPAINDFDAAAGSSIDLPQGFAPVSDELSLSASSGAVIKGADIKVSAAGLDVSSGAIINVSLTADALACEVSSGAVITISGTAGRVAYDVASGGVLKAGALKAETGTVKASSGGVIYSSVANPISITTPSGGSVQNN